MSVHGYVLKETNTYRIQRPWDITTLGDTKEDTSREERGIVVLERLEGGDQTECEDLERDPDLLHQPHCP